MEAGMFWDDILQTWYDMIDLPYRSTDAPVALRGDRCRVCGMAIRHCVDTGEALKWGYGTLGMELSDGSWYVHTEPTVIPHRPERIVSVSDISPDMSRDRLAENDVR
jgi:hypothetical protein